MRTLKVIVLVIISTMALILTNSAYATTVIKMNLEDLTKGANLIFVGNVSAIKSEWGKGGRTIYTYVTFTGLKIVSGNYKQKEITVRLEGGTIGGYTLRVAGMPEFKINQKNMVFLRANDRAISPVVGWWQGRFQIVKDRSSGKEIVLDNWGNYLVGIKGDKLIKLKKGNVDEKVTTFKTGRIMSEIIRPKLIEPRGSIKNRQKKLQAGPGKRLLLEDFTTVIKDIAKNISEEKGREKQQGD